MHMIRTGKFTIMWLLLCAAGLSSPLRSLADSKTPGTDEHVIIWTDRDVFIAGEHLFYTFNLVSSDHPHMPSSRLGYLAIRGPYGLVDQMKIRLSAHGNSHGSIYLSDTLSTGLYEITGFTNWMRNAGEEQYFRKQIVVANRFDKEIPRLFPDNAIGTDHDREPTLADASHPGYITTAAVAHTEEDNPLNLPHGPLTGKRQKASLTINMKAFPEKIISMQVALVPAGSLQELPMVKSDTPENKPGSLFFHRETTKPIISARLTDKNMNTPAQGVRVILNVTDTITNLLYAETAHDGMVHFLLDNYYHNRELIFSLANKEDQERLKLEVFNPFDFQYPYLPSPAPGHAQLIEYIEKSQEILGISKTFQLDYIEKAIVGYESGHPPLLYKSPMVTIDLDDYFPLDNLREISRELIPSWRMRSTSAGIQHSIVCQTSRTILSGEPVFFLDGVIQTDITPWLHLGSKDLQKIHLLNLPWIHGDFFMPGIISIFTRDPSLHLNNQGIASIYNDTSYLSDAAVQPDYGAMEPEDHGIPDLRRLIFWKSLIPDSMHADIELFWYTGDLAGDYVIRVHALTGLGKEIINETMVTIQ